MKYGNNCCLGMVSENLCFKFPVIERGVCVPSTYIHNAFLIVVKLSWKIHFMAPLEVNTNISYWVSNFC